MAEKREKQKITKKRIYLLLGFILALALITEYFFAEPHFSALWHTAPGADILLGMGGAVIFVFIVKYLLAGLLQRSPDYYQKGGAEDDRNDSC